MGRDAYVDPAINVLVTSHHPIDVDLLQNDVVALAGMD